MSESSDEEATPLVVPIPNGHKVIHFIKCNTLHNMNTTEPILFNPGCQTTPTSWRIDVTCEERPGGFDIFSLTIKLKRTDHLPDAVKVGFGAAFFGENGGHCIDPMTCDRMLENYEELRNMAFNVDLEIINFMHIIKVVVLIENCHSDTDLQFASKFVTNQKRIDQNSKL